ncbi:HPF/RaiA family ribosome-associated protein [Pseudoxanthomonas wuyuanensis]
MGGRRNDPGNAGKKPAAGALFPLTPAARQATAPSPARAARHQPRTTREIMTPFPLKITFQGMDASPALQADIEQHAAKLERFAPRLTACSVSVQQSERRHQKGNRYLVRIHATLPGGEIEAGHTAAPDRSHEDPYVAVRDAFTALRRQLEDFVRIQRGDVKRHSLASPPP